MIYHKYIYIFGPQGAIQALVGEAYHTKLDNKNMHKLKNAQNFVTISRNTC